MTELLEEKKGHIRGLCERHGVLRLEAFGSSVRDDFDPARSDLDFLVEFKEMEPYARVEAYFGLLDALRDLFGRDIDLVMVDAVRNPYIAADIEKTKQLLYAA